jgi:hypothetical protein
MKAENERISSYFPLLIAGRGEELLGLFDGTPRVDDPRSGRVRGRADFTAFVDDSYRWLSEHRARLSSFRPTRTEGRTVVESVLNLDSGAVSLPVAVVGEQGAAGLSAVRVYYSMWPLTGKHRVRRPPLEVDSQIEIPDVVGRYQRALAEGSLEEVLSLFEQDGYAREPAGAGYVHRGPEELREFYGGLFDIGPIRLGHCAVTDDGVCCCIEYVMSGRWGGMELEPQGGIAVYERSPGGLLAAARIYDDINVEGQEA